MSRAVWYKYSDWFKQPRPPAFLRSRVIIPHCHRLWGASTRNEFPYRIIQLAFEHGLQAGQFGTGACPYRGAQEVAWIRGYYYASQQDGSTTQSHHSLRLLPREWTRQWSPVRLTSSSTTLPQVTSDIDYWCSDIEYLGGEWGRRMRYEPNPWYRDNHINRLYEESGNSYKARAFTSDNLDTHSQNSYQSEKRSAFRDFRISASGISAATYGELGHNSATGLKKNFKCNGAKILTGFMSKNQLRFHRGYEKLNYDQQTILRTHFVSEVTRERKFDLLKITQTEYDKQLDLSLKAVAREIGRIATTDAQRQTLEAQMIETTSRQAPQEPITQLGPSRIFSYVHKVAINDSRRNPYPISLDENGHYNPKSRFVEGPIDPNVYCLRQDGELYAVVPDWEWARLRRQGQLDNYLADHHNGTNVVTLFPNDVPPALPIRILRQTRKRQWLVGKEDDLKHIRILKGLEHIAIAGQTPEVDALKAIWGQEKLRGSKEAALDSASGPIYLDNDAYLPACRTQESFDQKAMHGFQTPEGVQILGIQSPEAKLEIKQKLAEFTEKISEAEEQGQTDPYEKYKKDMKDFKSLTKGSCITKTTSKPIDGGDIFRSILNNLRQRRTSALRTLRKAGLHDEADDLQDCYKIESRTVIFFADRSRFTWVFDREIK